MPAVVDVPLHFLRAMRPVQWVKNVFVLAPLVFGLRLNDPAAVVLALAAAALFSLVSSAVYVLNDLVDRKKDLEHPTKRNRPIASGALPVEAAVVGLGMLVVAGIGGAVVLDGAVALVLTGYFALNVAYSARLKQIPFVDVGCIAFGFLLRVLAGGLAIDQHVSVWLLACTFLLATLLALGKRLHELSAVTAEGGATRDVLHRYERPHIELAMRVLAVVTVSSYTAYTLSPNTVQMFGTRALAGSVPFVVFGLWRFFHLVRDHEEASSPTDTMVHDKVFLANMGAWVVYVTGALYFA